MEKENISIIAQLLTSMKEATSKLEEAQKNNDMQKLAAAKKEILNFQREIEKIL